MVMVTSLWLLCLCRLSHNCNILFLIVRARGWVMRNRLSRNVVVLRSGRAGQWLRSPCRPYRMWLSLVRMCSQSILYRRSIRTRSMPTSLSTNGNTPSTSSNLLPNPPTSKTSSHHYSHVINTRWLTFSNLIVELFIRYSSTSSKLIF